MLSRAQKATEDLLWKPSPAGLAKLEAITVTQRALTYHIWSRMFHERARLPAFERGSFMGELVRRHCAGELGKEILQRVQLEAAATETAAADAD